MMIELTQVIY